MMDLDTMHASRAALIAALMLAAPALAYSQAGYVIPGARAPRDPPPRFTIAPLHGAPGSIGLPLPRIGLGPHPTHPTHPRTPFTDSPSGPGRMVFYVPPPVAAPPPPPPVEAPAPGRLVLDVEPSRRRCLPTAITSACRTISARRTGARPLKRGSTASTSARPGTSLRPSI